MAGQDPVTELERALALVVATHGTASHSLAGVLHGMDGVCLASPFVTARSRSKLDANAFIVRELLPACIDIVNGVSCTNGTQTLVDLAQVLDECTWEQALESALRQKKTSIGQIEDLLPALAASRRAGTKLIRHVLAVRPKDAPPTESLLETLMVQLIRNEPALPVPTRQVVLHNNADRFVARVDLAWPEHGVFLELDGEHHKGQPVHDANRQTAVVALTGWLPGRFTWTEVTRTPKATARSVRELLIRAAKRSVV